MRTAILNISANPLDTRHLVT